MNVETLIENPTERESKKSRVPYLNVWLPGIGNAQCWYQDLWGVLYRAVESGKPIRLEIEQDTGKDPRNGEDRTFTRIVGVEHPGQMAIPGA